MSKTTRRYNLGFDEIIDTSMYNDYTPIITINDDEGDLAVTLIGKEAINHYIKTGEILFNLKKNGKMVPLSDVLISAIALRVGASVLTLDSHFREIENVRLVDLRI